MIKKYIWWGTRYSDTIEADYYRVVITDVVLKWVSTYVCLYHKKLHHYDILSAIFSASN